MSIDDNPLAGQKVASFPKLRLLNESGRIFSTGHCDPDTSSNPAASSVASSPRDAHWVFGDMNFDGQVTGDDVSLVVANLGKGVGNPLGVAIPEPGGIGVAAVLACVFCRRKRRSR